MRCYLDNDALHKLAALGLVDEALAAIGADELRVLATAKFKFMVAKNPDKGRAKFGGVVWERLRAVLEVTGGVGPTDAKDLDVLTDVLDIDEGEAVLFSAAARLPESVLVTGDKRSLQALAGAPSCEEIVRALSGRVLCLEQVIERLISHVGFETVVTRTTQSTLADASLSAVFGMPRTPESVAEGLESYISDIRERTGPLLA